MIEIVCVGGAAVIFFAAFWADRFRLCYQDRAYLMREVSELTSQAQVLHDNSPQAIVKIDAKGLIRTANPAAEELFGYRAHELIGLSILKLLPGADRASRPTETLEIQCKDGSRLRLPFRAAKSDAARASYVYLFFDHRSGKAVPDSKLSAQPALPYTAKIVGRIAGQYEALLTTINGYSELALTGAPESSPLRQELQEIMTASHRASTLTRRLVAFSGGQILPVEPVDLDVLVKDMRPQLHQAVPGPIDFDLQPMDRASLANGDCLRQAILLLCGSAHGRMRETDRMQVRTGSRHLTDGRLVQSGELKAGIYGALTISDSGRPLDAQIKDHLFEPLYRIHEDMGVDLSPIYGMIRSLGGGIDVMTGDGIGTTFEILLPCVS
jgi:two-component system cell cycle sensor histidine kinase/response regulator CckA